MEKRIEISLLLDYYSSLLTDKQKDIMDLYYNKDLSLSEIAQLNNTSRQAISDLTKRCCNILFNYEKKLKLFENYNKKQNKIKDILKTIECIQNINKNDEILKLLCNIKKEIEDI